MNIDDYSEVDIISVIDDFLDMLEYRRRREDEVFMRFCKNIRPQEPQIVLPQLYQERLWNYATGRGSIMRREWHAHANRSCKTSEHETE